MEPRNFQCLLGLRCDDFTMVAADQTTARDVMVLNNDTDKLYTLSNKLLVGITGEPGDCLQLSEYVARSLDLYRIKNGYQLDIAASVHFTRKTLSDAVRTANNFNVNMLLAGFDDAEGGKLYYIDAFGTCVEVPVAAQGYPGMLASGVINQFYSPGMSEADGYLIMQMCVREIHQRWFLSLPNFQVKVVNRSGISTCPIISHKSLMDFRTKHSK